MKFVNNSEPIPATIEKPKRFVTVFLFTEVDEQTGNATGIQYELTAYEVNDLLAGIDENKTLLQFGNTFHHSDDIIRIVLN